MGIQDQYQRLRIIQIISPASSSPSKLASARIADSGATRIKKKRIGGKIIVTGSAAEAAVGQIFKTTYV